MRKQRIPIMTTSAFGFIAICIVVIRAWDIFTEARTQTPAPQGQMSPYSSLCPVVVVASTDYGSGVPCTVRRIVISRHRFFLDTYKDFEHELS